MDEDDKKDSDKGGDNASTSQQEGDRGSDIKEMSDHDGMEVPSPRHGGSSEASEVFSEDPLKPEEKTEEELEELEDEVKLRILRCLTSSFLAGARCSLHSPESQALESDYFYLINGIRAKEKTGPFTDVSTFDRNDGVIVDQSITQIQQGMVNFFTDEIRNYLSQNNEPIPCQGTHSELYGKIRTRMILLKRLKSAVDELAGEIPNHTRMHNFVRLKKDINGLTSTFTKKFSLLRALEESVKNIWVNENPQTLKHFLKATVTDMHVILENVNFPDNWTQAQFFQVMCEEVMERAKKMIDVDKIFAIKGNEGSEGVLNATKFCLSWRKINEFLMLVFEKKLNHERGLTGNIFGSVMAYIRRCKSFLEICFSNAQLYSSFSGKEEGQTEKEKQIDQIYFAYGKKLSPIAEVRYKALDIKDESLGALFEKFHSEMHNIDTMILSALKASFEDVANIKEQCEILDIFYSMSERSRVKATYNQRADNVSSMLNEELSRLMHESPNCLSYSLRMYSAFTVDLIRAHGLVQRSNAIVEDVTISNVFLSDVSKIKNVHKHKAPIKTALERKIDEAKRTRNYLDKMEIAFKSYLICRSAGFEGSLDINVNRNLSTASFDTNLLESLGVNIISGRMGLFQRHDLHKFNVASVCRLVNEYNMMFAKLSQQERGLFRSKILALDRRIWNGIYRITWQEQNSIAPWVEMCQTTIFHLTRDILEYKRFNSQIQSIMSDMKRLNFIEIDELMEYEPDKFCKVQYNKILKEVNMIKSRTAMMAAHVKRIKALLDIDEGTDENAQWSGYKTALGNYLADSLIVSLGRSMKALATILKAAKNKPIIKTNVVLQSKVLAVSVLGKDMCLFLDSFKSTAESLITSGICEEEWQEIVLERIEQDLELNVCSKIIQDEVEATYRKLQKYLGTLIGYKDLWSLNPSRVLQIYKNKARDSDYANPSVQSFVKDLSKLKDYHTTVSKLSKKRWVGFVSIDATLFIQEIKKHCSVWKAEFIDVLTKMVQQHIEEAEQLLDQLNQLISSGEIQGREDLIDEILGGIEKRSTDTLKILGILKKNEVNVEKLQIKANEIRNQYLVLKKDRHNILLQTKDASLKAMEQMKRAKEISQQLEDMEVSYRQSCPYTSSWKSEEALIEIASFKSRLQVLKDEVSEHECESQIEGFETKTKELDENLGKLDQIWTISKEWEDFESATFGEYLKNLQTDYLVSCSKQVQEKITAFCADKFDNRIEIHQTIQQRMSIFAGNLSIIEAFRSKAIKDRHWELISKSCGFQAIQNNELVIESMTLEEFASLNLERQSTEIKAIIEKAKKEFNIEVHLSNVKQDLCNLAFKYKINSNGIKVITNDNILIESIRKIMESLGECKESEASEPFKPEIETLELRLTETTKKINLIKKVESSFNILSEVSASYSLDLQLGKFTHKLSILSEFWKSIHQEILDRNDLVDAMNDDNLEGNIWAVEQEIIALEKMVQSFLSTRKNVFPKFGLCSDQKLKFIFCSHSIQHTNDWVSFIFPQVSKLIIQKENNEQKTQVIKGFITNANIQKYFLTPIPMDVTTDFLACKILQSLRESFKDEIYQIAVVQKRQNVGPSTGGPGTQIKQQEKYAVNSGQITFVTRLLAFCNEFNKIITFEDRRAQKQHILDTLIAHNNRMEILTSTMKETKKEEQMRKYSDAMGIEITIKQKIEHYTRMIFDDSDNIEKIKTMWHSMLKYTMTKEPFDVVVSVQDRQIGYGFDESGTCDPLFVSTYLEKSLNQIGRLMSLGYGSVLDGEPFSGRFTTLKCYAQFLGRHLIPFSKMDVDAISHVQSFLLSLESSQDLICFRGITSQHFYSQIFAAALEFRTKLNEFKKYIWNVAQVASPYSSTAAENPESRIFYISSFPTPIRTEKSLPPFVGMERHKCAISPLDLDKLIYCALLAEGFPATEELNEIIGKVLTTIEDNSEHPQTFKSISDLRMILKKAQQKVQKMNASSEEAIIGAIVEVANTDTKLIRKVVWDDVKSDIDKLAESTCGVEDKQLKFCEEAGLTITPNFRKTLLHVTNTLKNESHIMLFGEPITQKTMLWKTASAIKDYEEMVISSLAIEEQDLDLNMLNLGKKGERMEDTKDLLLVIEGSLTRSMMSALTNLLEYNTFVIKDDGQPVQKSRNIKVVIETTSIASLDPTISSFFKMHHCSNKDVSWRMMLSSKLKMLLQNRPKLAQKQEMILESSDQYVEYILKCRKKMGFSDTNIKLYQQINSMTGFLGSMIGDGGNLDDEQLIHNIIYACIFCFTQDIPNDVKIRMEIKIRSIYELRNVPVQHSIYDHFYDSSTKLWKPLMQHPLVSQANLKSENIILEQHMKQEIVARIMLKNLVSVDIQGKGGVGKTTILQNLLQHFRVSEFFGLSIPSASGTTLPKITQCIMYSMRKDEEASQSTGLSQVRKNFLFCLDDVDVWHGSRHGHSSEQENESTKSNKADNHLCQFIKFFSEHKTWFQPKNANVASYNNQVMATSRTADIGAVDKGVDEVQFNAVRINIDEIERQQLITIFKASLKEKFLVFELDIQFLIIKVIMAVVDINKIFLDFNRAKNLNYFHVQDNMKIITGLRRAHRDCHDTRYELLELWMNEVHYTYFEKLMPSKEKDELHGKVSDVMKYYFGDEGVNLLNDSYETLIGDFLDPYEFYTTIEVDELKEYVINKTEEMKSKYEGREDKISADQKINVIPSENTCKIVCQLMRVMDLPSGHMLIYGSAIICPRSIVELVCHIKKIKVYKLTNCDIASDKWQKKLRAITKVCGLEKKRACLYVPLEIFAKHEVRSSIDSMIDVGYDLSLFSAEELEIMCQRQGYFLNMAENTKNYFHCIIFGKEFTDISKYFPNENMYVYHCGDYRDQLLDYAKELITEDEQNNLPLTIFKSINVVAEDFFNQEIKKKMNQIPSNLNSYVCFIEIFKKYIKLSLQSYEEVLQKIRKIVTRIQTHFEFSEDQVVNLDKMKEKAKLTSQEHQNVSVNSVQTKKELAEVESLITQGMNEYSEEQASMLRLNMAIVEERTCQWSLYQRSLRDFDDSVLDEGNMQEFGNLSECQACVANYIEHYQKITEIDDKENFCMKLRYFLSSILEIQDTKGISLIGDNEQLQSLKDKVTSEIGIGTTGGSNTSIILISIVKLQDKMKSMSKSMKTITVKENKLQTLQKKCANIEERLKDHRLKRRNLQGLLKQQELTMGELQGQIQQQNEAINSLEHSATEHKNLKEPLEAFLNFLQKMEELMTDEKQCLPGSILLGAAFCGFSGNLTSDERKKLIRCWQTELTKEGIGYKDDFITHMMTPELRMSTSNAEATMIKQNLALLCTLTNPILIIDPVQVALEYLDLFHSDTTHAGEEKITLLHIGDPEFQDQFTVEGKASDVSIIIHSTLDLSKFNSKIELNRIKPTPKMIFDANGRRVAATRKTVFYHVAPEMIESQMIHVNPSQVISFDLDKKDVFRYVHSRFQMLMPDKARLDSDDSATIATDKDKFDIELQPYIQNENQILDFNHVTQSVDRIKKIFDKANTAALDKEKKEKIDKTTDQIGLPVTNLLETYSKILTHSFFSLKTTSFLMTIPISLQQSLTLSKKSLDTLESLEKKELTIEKIANVVIDTIMRFYDTNIQKFDAITLKTSLLFFLYSVCNEDKSENENVKSMLAELLNSDMRDPTIFFERLRAIQKPGDTGLSKLSEAISQILNCLRATDFETYQSSSESILNTILPQKINNDRDLYRVYAKSTKNTPTIVKIDADISFLEAMSKFKVNFQLDDIIMINLCHQHITPVRLLEDSMEHATWMLVTGVENKPDIANLLDFLIRRLKTNKSVHENFRLWVVCEELEAINLSTAQKCTCHFLGDDIDEEEERESGKGARQETTAETDDTQKGPDEVKKLLRNNLLESLTYIVQNDTD